MNTIKCFFKIGKVYVKLSFPFRTLFNVVAQRKYLSSLPLLLWNPACFFLKGLSTADRCRIILANTLLGTESRMIPLQLLQSFNKPFLRILTIAPFVHSVGTCFLYHISSNSGLYMLAARMGSALKSSALRFLCPGALLFFRDFMTRIISSVDGGSRLTLRFDAAGGIFPSGVGASRFNIFLKCLARRFFCSLSLSLSGKKLSSFVFDDLGLIYCSVCHKQV